jgi:GTP-binding protein
VAEFVDRVVLHIAAGSGGNGCASVHREKFKPLGGPDGGNGGRGGDVVLEVAAGTASLLDYHKRPHRRAGSGKQGQGSHRKGADGETVVLPVPNGTVVKTPDGEVLADLVGTGTQFVAAAGGRGGLGNARFATSTNRAPRKVQPGEPGEVKDLRLELRLLADVGLVGFPNAGKSTLISRVSAARPKIADYPFTTLTPNLGVVGLSDDRSFVVADVPGLIEGAHRGLGLGHQFLRHLERTKVLVHLVDISGASGRDPVHDLDTLRRELELFDPALIAKPQLVAANKIDAADDASRIDALERRASELGLPFLRISAATGAGIPDLLEAMWHRVVASGTTTRDSRNAAEHGTENRTGERELSVRTAPGRRGPVEYGAGAGPRER